MKKFDKMSLWARVNVFLALVLIWAVALAVHLHREVNSINQYLVLNSSDR